MFYVTSYYLNDVKHSTFLYGKRCTLDVYITLQ